ncbi:MAG: methyltransferase domain-containing protein [Chloroflexota bacterium]|nr:methyltransferase domain-containing protein [Chloroflexota bacterium]
MDQRITQSNYDPHYFAKLFAIEDQHFWFRARNRVITTVVAQIVAPLAPGYRVLEVGCGTGNVLHALKDTCREGTVIGMDLFIEGLRYARQRTNAPLVQGNIHTPPFNTPFAVIGLFDVLEHLDNDRQVLADLYRLLAPGGTLLLTVPAHRSLWSYFDQASHHRRRYEAGELHRKLNQTGYRVAYLTEFMTGIFPLVWLGRRWAAWRGHPQSGDAAQTRALTERELHITPGINTLLSLILAAELPAIARRRRLPIGTSLLAVARKSATAKMRPV